MVWFFIIFILLIIMGFPIYFGLTGASLIYFLLNPNTTMFVFIQKQMNAPNNFTLIAVPFFILAANIMNKSGITDRIFKFCNAFVGHHHGGLGYVNVIASMVFSGMSGAATADAGGLGLVEIKAMREAGYDDDFIIGVTAASSTIGPIIPPSIPMVIYGVLANVSVGGLFIGGLIPGILMGISLCFLVFLYSKKREYPRNEKVSIKEKFVYFKYGFLSLLMPIIILGGIWGGFFTPTEAAFISIVYAFLISFFVFKTIKVKDIPGLLLDTIRLTAPAIILVAGASIFAWIMIYERVDKLFIDLVFSITENPYIILLIINAILFFLGMFVDVTSAIMLVMPILYPLSMEIGIHPIHLGIIVVLNLMIGLMTPPVGGLIYILSSVTKIPSNKITMMVLPWIIPLVFVLFLVTFIPDIVLFLPRLLGFIQ
jgi:tripartite ATP-independent transporter DctM subunit